MVGAATLKGQTKDRIIAAKVADKEVGSLNDPNKVFFFYNVKTGKFLSMGGYWGVHAALKETPVAFWAQDGSSKAINFAQDLKTQQGSLMKWVENSKATDEGVFLDRGNSLSQYYTGFNGWFLEKDPTDVEHNTYRLYTYQGITTLSKKVYLSALGDVASEKNCDADSKDNLTKNGLWDEHTLWRVISLQEILGLMDQASENLTDPLDLTFNLACPGFDRGRMDIDAWQSFGTNVAEGGYARIGLEQCYEKFVPTNSVKPLTRSSDEKYEGKFDKNYKFPYKGEQPQIFADREDYKRHMAKYFCMDVRGMHGYIYQKQNVTKAGTYVIECKGYSNTPKALLFAGIGQNNGSGLVEGTKRTTTLNQVSNMPADEQARLHVSELNMDYAGKEFYESNKYTNSVSVHVTKEMIEQAGAAGGVSIAFGIYIGNLNDASETPNPNEWTVFDDFRVLYASNTKSPDLILDELRGDLDYLRNGTTTYTNRMLHLAKTFTKDHWNSFVLPVDLTVKQVRDAFGANVRLAKLKNLTNTELQFETVNLDENEKATAIQAYQPYIIFPTKTMEAYNGTPYTANITTGTGSDYKVTIQGQRFQIPNVTFKTTDDNKNDLTNMNTDNWTTKLTDDKGAITAYGTFVRTFDPDATQDEMGVWKFSDKRGTIIPGYDDLVGSYFFDYGNVYYSDTNVRGLRGFSCWFKPNTSNDTKPALYLDGVKQEAELTAIGELIVGPEAANRYGKNNGVYNLQGQRVGNTTEGLPSGIYIVNGRKFVVR